MTILRKSLMLAATIAIFGAVGCTDNDNAEKAGDNVEKAGNKTGQAIENAGEKTEEAAEKTGDKANDIVH